MGVRMIAIVIIVVVGIVIFEIVVAPFLSVSGEELAYVLPSVFPYVEIPFDLEVTDATFVTLAFRMRNPFFVRDSSVWTHSSIPCRGDVRLGFLLTDKD